MNLIIGFISVLVGFFILGIFTFLVLSPYVIANIINPTHGILYLLIAIVLVAIVLAVVFAILASLD